MYFVSIVQPAGYVTIRWNAERERERERARERERERERERASEGERGRGRCKGLVFMYTSTSPIR